MKKILYLFAAIILCNNVLAQETKDSFVGIGVEFKIVADTLRFTSVITDGPAYKAGLKKEDKLLFVNEQQVTNIGLQSNDVQNMLRGNKGTSVTLKIKRQNDVLTFDIVRDVVSPELRFNHYRKAAEQGDANAQGALGYYYAIGDGVKENKAEAVRWYRKAAQQGDAYAQGALGYFYAIGDGVKEDKVEAVRWYRKAAEQGRVGAQNNLGVCYDNGLGVKEDKFEAVRWFRKAAEQGDANAQYNLGNCYYNGNGVKKNDAEALDWFEKALVNKKNLDEKSIEYAEATIKKIELISPRFSSYAKTYVQERINEWQKKGEFEKTADWQSRVNETTRKAKATELLKDAERTFIAERSKEMSFSNMTLDTYDPDNEVYLIKAEQYGNLLLPVPIKDAQAFKTDWNTIQKTPKYFIENDKLALAEISFKTSSGKSYTYSNQASLNYSIANIDYNFDPIDITLPSNNNARKQGNQTIATVNMNVGKADVDVNIPTNTAKNDKVFAIIISNENYQRESQVEFANNDGKIFKEYCIKTLGLPENNIHLVADATLNNIRAEINWISNVAQAYNNEANIIFYYAGHGIPDESSKTAYLLPIDGYGSDVTTGYKLDDLYSKLGGLPAKNITVFMDACFSGAQRSGAMLASARGVAIKATQGKPSGNMVVFSAAQGDETAYPYKEKGHGLFTYFLLKKLQESKGNTTLGELSDYISTNVRQQSIVVNSKSQTPTVIPSSVLGEKWSSLKLK